MCDCEEMEFEDFEVMLSAISARPAPPVEASVAPLIKVSTRRNR